MLKIKVAAVGKLKEKALRDLTGEYIKRLGRYCSLEIIELDDESVPGRESADPGASAAIAKCLKAESARILGRVAPGAYVIALDMTSGAAPDSIGFAKLINELTGRVPEIVFVVGGSHGLHPDVLARADYALSMSKLTFTHQLARLILLEQLYRAFKIIGSEVYHK